MDRKKKIEFEVMASDLSGTGCEKKATDNENDHALPTPNIA